MFAFDDDQLVLCIVTVVFLYIHDRLTDVHVMSVFFQALV